MSICRQLQLRAAFLVLLVTDTGQKMTVWLRLKPRQWQTWTSSRACKGVVHDVFFLLKDFGFHSAVTWDFTPPSFVLCSGRSVGFSSSTAPGIQLGENVFLPKLALPQHIFPQSMFWAHPGYGAKFCKCLLSKA